MLYYYYVLRDSMVCTRKKKKSTNGITNICLRKRDGNRRGRVGDKSDLLYYRACEIRILSFISWWRKVKINKRGTQSLYTDRGEVFTLFSKVSRRHSGATAGRVIIIVSAVIEFVIFDALHHIIV